MAREVRSEIEINASASRVWETLTDFDRFPLWNPFILKVFGEVKVGARVDMQIRLHDGRVMNIRPSILRIIPERELRWIGRLGIPGLVDGEHIFSVEPVDGARARLEQHEIFRGLLVPLLWWRLRKDAGEGFKAMNKALKEVIEREEAERQGI